MIDSDVVERIKAQLPLSQVIGERVRLERRGGRFVGLCPFHKEKTPSFNVNDERGFYHCFGCKATGDVIGFVRETEGLSFVEAVTQLGQRLGIEIATTVNDEDKRRRDVARKRRDELYAVNAEAANFFEQCLTQHKLRKYAHDELGRRGLSAEDSKTRETMKAFRMGYAPNGWDELAVHLRGLGFSHQAAEAVGLLAPRKSGSGHYDRFRHRLMFAISDLQGRVIGFSGRALEPPPGEGASDSVAKYINSPETQIYKKREAVFGLFQARQAIRDKDLCVMVEGNFDVVSLHARGIEHVAAPLGTAFTEEQANLVKRFTGNLVFLFDADKAGQRATRSAREPAQKAGLACYVATLPDGKDPDDVISEYGARGIEQILNNRRSMLEYLIESTLDSGFKKEDPHTRATKIQEVTALIASEEDPTLRAMARRHADQIAARLNIADVQTLSALTRAVERASRGNAPEQSSSDEVRRQPMALPPERARSQARLRDVERQIVSALAAFPKLLIDPEIRTRLAGAQGELALAVVVLHSLAPADPASDSSRVPTFELLEKLPEAYRHSTAEFLTDTGELDLRGAHQLVLNNFERLTRAEERRLKETTLEELRQASTTGDMDEELRLLQEQMQRAKRRHGL